MQSMIAMGVVLAASLTAGASKGPSEVALRSEHTLPLEDPAARPRASLSDVAFMVGAWRGEGLGATVDEIWSEPAAGAMMGMCRVVGEKGVHFYEMCTINEDQGSLVLCLKHFHADLKGWEGRDEVRSFRLVKIEKGAAWFEGMTMRRLPDGGLQVYVAIRQKDGSTREEEFRYRRVGG